MGIRLGLFFVMVILSVSISTGIAYAESSVEWKSEYRVGILNEKSESLIPVKVTTFSKDALKIQWEYPEILKNAKKTFKPLAQYYAIENQYKAFADWVER